MKIVMVTLTKITFMPDEDTHTVAYVRDVKDWMQRWLASAHYNPICTAVDDENWDFIPEAPLLAIEEAATAKFKAFHVERLKAAVPRHTATDRDYAKDFRFTTVLHIAESGDVMEVTTPGQLRVG